MVEFVYKNTMFNNIKIFSDPNQNLEDLSKLLGDATSQGYDKAAVTEAVTAMTEALLGFAEDESEPMREVPDNIISNTTFEVSDTYHFFDHLKLKNTFDAFSFKIHFVGRNVPKYV